MTEEEIKSLTPVIVADSQSLYKEIESYAHAAKGDKNPDNLLTTMNIIYGKLNDIKVKLKKIKVE